MFGITILAAGGAVTLPTLVFVPSEKIIFGVLTLIGISMILTGALRRMLEKIPYRIGAVICFLLFLILRPINGGYLNFGTGRLMLPQELYCNGFSALLGLPNPGFFSTDYFSVFNRL